jgi:hypothetical protein
LGVPDKGDALRILQGIDTSTPGSQAPDVTFLSTETGYVLNQ